MSKYMQGLQQLGKFLFITVLLIGGIYVGYTADRWYRKIIVKEAIRELEKERMERKE